MLKSFSFSIEFPSLTSQLSPLLSSLGFCFHSSPSSFRRFFSFFPSNHSLIAVCNDSRAQSRGRHIETQRGKRQKLQERRGAGSGRQEMGNFVKSRDFFGDLDVWCCRAMTCILRDAVTSSRRTGGRSSLVRRARRASTSTNASRTCTR
jgi:hypothetical protein